MANHIIRETLHQKRFGMNTLHKWTHYTNEHTTQTNKCQATQQANLQVMNLETTEQSSLLKLWAL